MARVDKISETVILRMESALTTNIRSLMKQLKELKAQRRLRSKRMQ